MKNHDNIDIHNYDLSLLKHKICAYQVTLISQLKNIMLAGLYNGYGPTIIDETIIVVLRYA